MSPQVTVMFSKLLTPTDINKRMAIPSRILTSLPGFNGNHAVTVHVMYGTKMWQLECSVRKKGYKKPVFSGGLWRNFVIRNNFSVGDRISMYKVQDEDATSHFMVEVEKPALALIDDHEVDETSLMMLASVATVIVNEEARCEFISDQRFSSDLVLGPPRACVDELKLDLSLAPP